MDLHVIGTIGEYAFRRVVTGWFRALLAVAAVLILLLLFSGGPDPQKALLNHRAMAFSLIELAVLTLVTLMGATELPRDVDSRTVLVLLSKPLDKRELVLGKFVGVVLAAAFASLILSAVCLGGCAVQGLWPDANSLQKSIFCFFRAIPIAAVVILLSTRLSEVPIIFFTGAYVAVGYFIYLLQAILVLETIPLPAKGVIQLIYFLAPNLRFLEIPEPITVQGTVGWLHLFVADIYALCYAAVLLFVSVVSFDRREVAG